MCPPAELDAQPNRPSSCKSAAKTSGESTELQQGLPLVATWRGQLMLIGMIGVIQVAAIRWPWWTLMTTFPLFALAKSAPVSASNATRPSRFYLACLLIAGTSILGELAEFSDALHSLTDATDSSALTALSKMLPRMGARILIPFAAGLAGLIVFGQMDAEQHETKEKESSTSWMAELNHLLQQSDAPEQLVGYMNRLSVNLETLSSRYDSLADSATASDQAFQHVTIACGDTTRMMQRLCEQMGESQRDLQSMRKELRETQLEIGQLQSQVDEMGEVLDQFAEIAEHKIMRYRPEAKDDQVAC